MGHRQIQPSAVAIQGVTQHSIHSHFGGVTQNSEVPSVPWPLMVSQHHAVKSPVRFMPPSRWKSPVDSFGRMQCSRHFILLIYYYLY